jgi:hypothetical protein
MLKYLSSTTEPMSSAGDSGVKCARMRKKCGGAVDAGEVVYSLVERKESDWTRGIEL